MTTRRRRSRWNDPKIWVPLLTAVIASVVGPILVIYYQTLFPPPAPNGGGGVNTMPENAPVSQPPPGDTPENESDGQPQPQKPPPSEVKTTGSEGLTIDADKLSYVVGETAVFTGSIGKAEEGKTVRIDIHDPHGQMFKSNLNTKTDFDGNYSYPVILEDFKESMVAGEETMVAGEYTTTATVDKQSAETKFNVSHTTR